MSVFCSISLQTELLCNDLGLTAFILIPAISVEIWNVKESATVIALIEGLETGKKSLKRLSLSENSDWILELTLPFCRMASIKAGDVINVSMKLA
jgi:hypothetical protein